MVEVFQKEEFISSFCFVKIQIIFYLCIPVVLVSDIVDVSKDKFSSVKYKCPEVSVYPTHVGFIWVPVFGSIPSAHTLPLERSVKYCLTILVPKFGLYNLPLYLFSNLPTLNISLPFV